MSRLLLCGALACGLLAVRSPVCAADRQEAIEDVRRCLQGGDYQWYDAKKDAPAPFSPQEEKETAERKKKLTDWFSLLLNIAGLSVIAAGLIGLIYWSRKFAKRTTPAPPTAIAKSMSAPLQTRPLPGNNGAMDFFDASRQAAQAGDFKTAIIYLYNHQLLALDREKLIRLHIGASNGQYLLQLGDQPARWSFQRCVGIFEIVFFGGREATEAMYVRLMALGEELTRAAATGSRVPE